jgi:hypothetical protein
MRAHHVIAVATFILVGAGVKLIFFPGPTAAVELGSARNVSVDVSAMRQQIKNLPVEKIDDMTFVFSDGG